MDINNNEKIVYEVLEKRRSIRRYQPVTMDPSVLFRIASAGALAPSAGNGQPCRFLVIDDNKIINALLDYSIEVNDAKEENENERQGFRSWSDMYRMVSAVILVLEDMQSNHPQYVAHDCPLAAANIMFIASAMGYGTTYLTDTISPEGVKKAIDIPDRYVPYCAIAIGIPAQIPEKPKKKNGIDTIWRNEVAIPFELNER